MKNPIVAVKQQQDGTILVTVGTQSLTFNPAKAHESNRAYAAFHGFKQRFVDAAAISRNPENGASASPAEKFDAISRIVAHLESGAEAWSMVRESSGPKGGFLFEALCRMYAISRTPEQIREYLDGLTDKQQAALREDDAVAPVIAEIKKEKAKDQPKMDTKALLAGLS